MTDLEDIKGYASLAYGYELSEDVSHRISLRENEKEVLTELIESIISKIVKTQKREDFNFMVSKINDPTFKVGEKELQLKGQFIGYDISWCEQPHNSVINLEELQTDLETMKHNLLEFLDPYRLGSLGNPKLYLFTGSR